MKRLGIWTAGMSMTAAALLACSAGSQDSGITLPTDDAGIPISFGSGARSGARSGSTSGYSPGGGGITSGGGGTTGSGARSGGGTATGGSRPSGSSFPDASIGSTRGTPTTSSPGKSPTGNPTTGSMKPSNGQPSQTGTGSKSPTGTGGNASSGGRADGGPSTGGGGDNSGGTEADDAGDDGYYDPCMYAKEDGNWCGSAIQGRDDMIYTCVNGQMDGTPETCAGDCIPTGTNEDTCEGATVDPCTDQADGNYCGSSIGGGAEADSLYTCSAGVTQGEPEACPNGCGTDATTGEEACTDMESGGDPEDPCSGMADGSYCGIGGDSNTLYECSGGALGSSEACENNCAAGSGGGDDSCE